jgi:hypothetical protein
MGTGFLLFPSFMSIKRQSGKVVHDARGTAVWDWAVATGVLAQKSAGDLLTTLNGSDLLTLEEVEAKPSRDWSGDPYNRSPHRALPKRRVNDRA